jgi:hypothetical protein
MKKSIIGSESTKTAGDEEWLSLEAIADIEVTSESSSHPLEFALIPPFTSGWRASEPGQQTIRLVFHEPQRLTAVHLVFEDKENAQTQEFVLSWSSASGGEVREIVRQQWNFSHPDSTREVENYNVSLPDVKVLELTARPSRKGGFVASLIDFRVK